MLVLIKRQRVGPHLAAIGVEDQRRIFRRGDPCAAHNFVLKLARCPASIAKCNQALLRPMADADIVQNLGRIAQGDAAIDIESVRAVVLRTVQRKSDIRAHRPAQKNKHAVGHALGIGAERGKHGGNRPPRYWPVDDDAKRAIATCAIMITARSNGSRKLGDAIRSWPANDVRPETSGSVGKAACRIAAGITIAIAATIQRLQCRLNKSATAGSLIEAMITPVPRTRSSHKFAACSDANFGFKSGTTKDRLASVIVDSEVRTSVPQMLTNFGIGTLARGNNQVQAPSISNKLHGDAAETAEIGVQCVALAGMHHARERAGEHQMADLERDAMLAEFVGEPCHAQSRMAEHAGGDAGLLDLGIAVHNAADPAQVDVERTDRTAADHDAGGGAVVGDSIENLARVL